MNIKKICALVAAFLLGAGIMVIAIGSMERRVPAQAAQEPKLLRFLGEEHQMQLYESLIQPGVVCYRNLYGGQHLECVPTPRGEKQGVPDEKKN